MPATLSLRAALRRGALVTAANWPVVLVEFGIESLYKLTLAVPVIGGSLMVAALVGADVREVVTEGVGSTADVVFGFLVAAPAALMSFLVALGLVALGGEIMMFVVKGATLHVLVRGDRCAPKISIADRSIWRRCDPPRPSASRRSSTAAANTAVVP